ncbi:hypothetical protein CDD81_7359 [Ophiocordyceps australis]|uniref:Uncharacterized protein n=1 Tax=Ophiocordyceps australis TaxID=1399860 RepID=A0A2C5XY34_9HYPO|nr:hypothetical protein CDD81_7359 [Ophiocordyceps australis]
MSLNKSHKAFVGAPKSPSSTCHAPPRHRPITVLVPVPPASWVFFSLLSHNPEQQEQGGSRASDKCKIPHPPRPTLLVSSPFAAPKSGANHNAYPLALHLPWPLAVLFRLGHTHTHTHPFGPFTSLPRHAVCFFTPWVPATWASAPRQLSAHASGPNKRTKLKKGTNLTTLHSKPPARRLSSSCTSNFAPSVSLQSVATAAPTPRPS